MSNIYIFYRSKEWQLLLEQLKHERLNEEGLILCEYCGKPIIKAYDCIGHHKEELTEENVLDVNISLNPNNIMLIHHKCHNIIHNKLGYKNKGIYIVYGSPLSGKSTYVNNVAAEGDLIIDIDNIWQMISGCERYIKPNRLKSVVFKVRDCLLESVKYRTGKWNNCYIIGGYPLQGERERLLKELSAKEIFIETSKEECLTRLEALDDSDNRKKYIEDWKQYIEDWFTKYSPPL